MRTVRLLGVRGRAFRTFKDDFSVRFPQEGLVLLRGVNEETGGGSGAGKSNLGMAVGYGLGYGSVAAGGLQSWASEEKMAVGVLLGTDDGEVWVRRTPGKLAVGGADASVTAAEEELARILGADPRSLGPLVHRRQGARGAFLSMADDEARELLAGPLGLDRLDAEAEAAGKRAKERRLDLDEARTSLAHWEGRLAGVPSILTENARHLVAKYQAEVAEAQRIVEACEVGWAKAHEMAEAARAAKVAPLRARRDEAMRRLNELGNAPPLPVELEAERSRLDGGWAELQKRKAEVLRAEKVRLEMRRMLQGFAEQAERDAAKCENDLIHMRLEMARLRKELEGLQVGDCPTCSRAWPEGAEAQRVALVARIAELEEDMGQVETYVRDKGAVEKFHRENPDVPDPKLERLTKVEANIQAAKAALEQRVRGWVERAQEEIQGKRAVIMTEVHALEAELEPLLMPGPETRAFVAPFKDALHEATNRAAELGTALRVAEETLRMGEAAELQRAEVAAKVDGCRAKVEGLQQGVAAEEDLEALLRQFLGKVVEEALVEVADEVNRLLAGVANVRHLTFAMRTEKTSRKGVSRVAMTPVVGIGGREVVGRSAIRDTLSGGQFAALELAVDLAVLFVVERRLGVRWGWLFLDEVFEGLGPVEKETALEIIREVAGDRLVVVVDHNSETAGLIENTITVRYRGGISVID